jgi:hypothetical protein
MRQDEYGAAIEAVLRSTTEPLSASEIRERVGCSRQRVYAWLQANEQNVQQEGKDRVGGHLYTWLDRPKFVRPAAGLGAVGATDTLQVKSFFVDAGDIVLVLVGPDGSTYHARPA